MITPESQQAIELYTFYKEKVLALSGGVLEQPRKYIELMKLIDRHITSER
jgi:hypothetical protein